MCGPWSSLEIQRIFGREGNASAARMPVKTTRPTTRKTASAARRRNKIFNEPFRFTFLGLCTRFSFGSPIARRPLPLLPLREERAGERRHLDQGGPSLRLSPRSCLARREGQ